MRCAHILCGRSDAVVQGSVLLVEDDSALRHGLSKMLQMLGFEIVQASSGEIALAELRARAFDVVLLDLNMPGMGGLVACEKIRNAYPRLPIIILTVRNGSVDKIAAFDAGADDYVTKPFDVPELAARIRAGVRRMRQPDVNGERVIQIEDICLDPIAHRLTKRGAEIHMTPKEFELLHVLMRHAGHAITHRRLLAEVWGEEYSGEREYLRTYISQIRRKIEDDPTAPVYLLTEAYLGYRFQSQT